MRTLADVIIEGKAKALQEKGPNMTLVGKPGPAGSNTIVHRDGYLRRKSVRKVKR